MIKTFKYLFFCVSFNLLSFYCGVVNATEKSSSILFYSNNQKIISANFDAGSVSIIDRSTGKIIKEQIIGSDIRRIALSSESHSNEQLLLATDYLNNKVILLNANTLEVNAVTQVPARPFGVVFDKLNNQFYVVSFEEYRLLTISIKGELTNSIETKQTPRGLALTDDGRLLITHSLTGEVSIYDVTKPQPKLDKVIKLINTPSNVTKSTPQGIPRLLDNIAISPDGKSAWLPHVLWSFEHEFRFNSTIFPAISILDLTKGAEKEIIGERKQLFKQITFVENDITSEHGKRVRIVSNPHDAIFADGGKKVFVSLAGSEDLMVFDLSHQMKKNGTKGGTRVAQIYSNVPGNNPKGLLSSGNDLYVQNAMTLDITKFDTGSTNHFSKIKLDNAQFAKLVNKDPLTAQMRLGKTLFNSANTAENKYFSMTANFWMSCSSCHLDGFNFTNKQLMQNGLKDKFNNATTGHKDVIKMIAGDPVKAYIDIIQKTQGGMRAVSIYEANFPIPVDVNKPPAEVVKMMSALNSYVTSQENLPYLSTWLRLDDNKKYTHPTEWINSARCKDCHSSVYDQWADSNHGMNMDHPFYRYQEDIAAKTEGEEFRVFCRGCHAPQMVINNDSLTQLKENNFGNMWEKKSGSLNEAYSHGQAVSERGTGCVFCHRISKIENAGGNADLTVNLKDRQGYLFDESSNTVLNWLSEKQINASPETHKASYSNPELYQSSLYCASCHNEHTPGTGANINDNFGEWLESSFNSPDKPSEHKTCIDCHMTQDVTNFDNKVAGQSTTNGKMKNNIRSHHFVGGNYYFAGMRSPEHKKLSIEILQNALTLDIEKQNNSITAKITNINSGHDMPGGARRQVWIEIIATDAYGKNIFQSGVMKNGFIPKDARKFIKIGVDKNGVPVGIRFWRYVKIDKDTRIKSGKTRLENFILPQKINYPLTVTTRILYQAFAKELTEKVRQSFPDKNIPEPEVIELVKVARTYSK